MDCTKDLDTFLSEVESNRMNLIVDERKHIFGLYWKCAITEDIIGIGVKKKHMRQ
jgi:hypothetical protein